MIDPVAAAFQSPTKSSRFWFVTTVVAIFGCLIGPYLVVEKMHEPISYVVIDPEKNAFIETRKNFDQVKSLHNYILSLAANAMLNRAPSGLDNELLAQQIYSKECYAKIQSQVSLEKANYERKLIHQKNEIDKVSVLEINDGVGLAVVTGQLVQMGKLEGEPYGKVVGYRLQLKFVRSLHFDSAGRLPMVIIDYKLELDNG